MLQTLGNPHNHREISVLCRSRWLVENNSEKRGQSAGTAVSAKRNGATPVFGDFITRLSAAIRGVSDGDLDAELKRWLEPLAGRLGTEPPMNGAVHKIPSADHEEIIGDSPALTEMLARGRQVARADATVLITGETGTGKELLARAIHRNSKRHDRTMVKVNCAALPSNLVEAELFGREKGAYTGAMTRELGRFEVADGSTILLDEIGELPLELQAKLLRVLQDGEFERLGSTKTRKVNVRVIAATNRDLVKAVEAGKFREDLYYRLSVFPIEVPSLRQRREDIPKLVWGFIEEFSRTMGKTILTVPEQSMERMTSYEWPGNVREVRNIIERAMIISDGPVLDVEMPSRETAPHSASRRLQDVEREHITKVARSTGWRIRGQHGAAEILGLKPTTLEARMKKLGITRDPI